MSIMLNENHLYGEYSENNTDLIPDFDGILGLGNTDITFNLDPESSHFTLDPENFTSISSPAVKPGPPSTETFSGEFNFQVDIDASNAHRKKFLYSPKAKCLFLNSMHNFSVAFSWDTTKLTTPMYVGTALVFADPSDAEKRVQTCLQHVGDKTVSSEKVNNNVLRSSRDLTDPDVFYLGGPDSNIWYSVLVRLPSPSSHAYYFVCKNSCSSGINRRPLNLIFTLQDHSGEVYGRQMVGVRICSCPKRDILRAEETEVEGKVKTKGKRKIKVEPCDTTNTTNTTTTTNASNAANTPRRKRVKVEADACDTVVTVPTFQVVGPRVALAGLEVMLSMMKQTKDLLVKSHQNTDDVTTKIQEMERLIENLQSSNTTG